MRLLIDETMPECEKLSDFLNHEFINKTAYAWVGNLHKQESLHDPEETVYLTEDYVTAQRLEKMGKCSVYVQRDPMGEFVSGITRIMTDPIEITEDYLWRTFDHYVGRPHVIGSNGRVLLRESTSEDFHFLSRAHCEDASYDLDQILRDKNAFEAYIGNAYSFYDFGYWTVVDVGSGKIVGWAGFSPSQDVTYGRAEIGYMILPAFRRRGYAVSAIEVCIHYGFEELDFQEVAALIEKDNIASVRTIRSAGFALASDADDPLLTFVRVK